MWKKKTKTSLNGNETQKKVNKTNRDIWFTGIFFSLLFVAMMGYYAHFVHTKGDEMINSSYNSRQKLLTAKNYRGNIYSADMEKLAETIALCKDQPITKRYNRPSNIIQLIEDFIG